MTSLACYVTLSEILLQASACFCKTGSRAAPLTSAFPARWGQRPSCCCAHTQNCVFWVGGALLLRHIPYCRVFVEIKTMAPQLQEEADVI